MPVALRTQTLIPAGLLLFVAGAVGLMAGADPVLALAAGLGVAFMLIVLADLYVGLILFILITFVADLPSYGGTAFTASKFAGLVLLISWLASLTMQRRRKADFISAYPGATWILLLFMGWLCLSQVWAESPSTSLSAVFRLSLNAILFLIVYTAVRTRSHMIGVAAAFVAGATLDALYGFVNPVSVANQARLAGAISKPGELAAALVAGLVLSIGLAVVLKRSPVARLAAVGAAALCALGVFLTGSRGGLIALAVALAVFILVGRRWRGRLLALAAVVGLAGVGFYTYAASPDLRARVTSVGSGSGRVDLWTVAWRMVQQEPIRGVGIGNFPVSSVNYVVTPGTIARAQYVIDDPKVAHNTYLELWAETGIVGLGLFLMLAAFCVRSTYKAAREFARQRDGPMEILSLALLVAQAGFLTGAFFTSREYAKDIWLVLALGPTFLGVARAQLAESSSEARPRAPEPTGAPAPAPSG